MLKIKDNVDLKELEKSGFKKSNNKFYIINGSKSFPWARNISCDDRIMSINNGDTEIIDNDEIIYDAFCFIPSHFIEKIEE